MNSRNRVWLFPLLLALLFPFWQPLVASFLAIHIPKLTPGPNRGQQLEMEGVTLRQFSQGRLDLLLQAQGVENSPAATDEYKLHGVKGQLLDSKGEITTIQGRQALFSAKLNVLTINDEVLVEGQGGRYRLHTDLLHYFVNDQLLQTDTPVHIFAEQGEIKGGSMEYNLATGDFRVGKRVDCRL